MNRVTITEQNQTHTWVNGSVADTHSAEGFVSVYTLITFPGNVFIHCKYYTGTQSRISQRETHGGRESDNRERVYFSLASVCVKIQSGEEGTAHACARPLRVHWPRAGSGHAHSCLSNGKTDGGIPVWEEKMWTFTLLAVSEPIKLNRPKIEKPGNQQQVFLALIQLFWNHNKHFHLQIWVRTGVTWEAASSHMLSALLLSVSVLFSKHSKSRYIYWRRSKTTDWYYENKN